MYLQLTDDQNLLKDTFGKLFRAESTSQRLREAKPLGFDPQLWAQLVELGAPAMRVPEASGGLGFSLLDCAVVVEEAGRYLASVPLVDVVVCARLLSEAGERGAGMLARLLDGSAKAALALMGQMGPTLRLPMAPATEATEARLRRVLGDLGLLS